MAYKIQWRNLLNDKRPRDNWKLQNEVKGSSRKEEVVNEDSLYFDHRNQFDRDYDRIVASSSLRRLQDKAQVFPLQESDFIRTRLTHSVEVSSIARSFGNWLEKWLVSNEIINNKDLGKIPSMLAVAGLVHDIGNPPFGHYGEDVIKNWFKTFFDTYAGSKQDFIKKYKISSMEMNDFLHFDGNAQGIRVLTKLQFLNDQFGINLTYGTLSILMKYPWNSSYPKAVDDKKFGYFQKDIVIAKEIIDATVKIENARNPLTYLLEASDDIAYLGADVEDGVKKRLIPWDDIFFNNIVNGDIGKIKEYKKDIEVLKIKHETAKKNGFPDYQLTSVQNFKVWAQSQMIREVKKVFMENYEHIMNGDFNGEELLDKSENGKKLKDFFKKFLLKNFVFRSREVLSLELVGDSVINELLDVFVKNCVILDDDYEYNPRCKAGKIFSMISDNFIFVHLMNEDINNPKKIKKMSSLSTYEKLLLITDFISGMTDSYALDLHQKLKGVKMP